MRKRLPLLIGAAALSLFLWRADLKAIAVAIMDINWPLLVLALFFALLNLLLKSWRWRSMVKAQTGIVVPLIFSFKSVIAGVAAASLAPGRLLDTGKPLLLHEQYGAPLGKIFIMAVAERLLDLVALTASLCAATFLLPIPGKSFGIPLRIGTAVALIAALLALAAPGLIANSIDGLLRCFSRGQRGTQRAIAATLSGMNTYRTGAWFGLAALSFLAMLAEIGRFWAVLTGMGIPVGLTSAAFTFLVSIFLGLAAMIPGGIGITETSAAGVLTVLLQEARIRHHVDAAVLIDRFLSYYILVFIGAILLIVGRGKKNAPKECVLFDH